MLPPFGLETTRLGQPSRVICVAKRNDGEQERLGYILDGRGRKTKEQFALVLGAWLTGSHLAAQPHGDSAHVRGIVRNANSGAPLAGALVAVHSVRFFYLTDSTGTFDVGLVPAGKRILTVVYRESPSV